jgi:hypothetical protein
MDGATIQQALLMILNVVIAALVSALTALGVSYFRTRGQNLATKHDFDELQTQLSENTKLVEAIKSEVSQRDWAQREWTTLRRIKLEALLEKMHESEDYLDQRRALATEGKGGTPDRKSINELDLLAALYFPELKNEVDLFVSICKTQRLSIIQYAQAVLSRQNDIPALNAAFKDYESKWNPAELPLARDALMTAARSLLERNRNLD